MIQWWWLIIYSSVFMIVGYFLRVLMVISKNFDREIERALQKQRMLEALRILLARNPLRNDRDAYLLHIANWGLGLEEKKPNPEDYGLEEAGKEEEV